MRNFALTLVQRRLTAAMVMLACAATLVGAPANAREPLARVEGLSSDAVFDIVRASIGTTDRAPTSRLAAERNATRAVARANNALRSEGFYEARFEASAAPPEQPNAPWTAVVRITPGPRFTLGPVALETEGLTPAQRRAIQPAFALSVGAPARAEDVQAAEARGLAALRALGFPDAAIAPHQAVLDYALDTVNVTFRYDLGPYAALGPPRSTGVARVRQSFLDRLAPYDEGEAYTPEIIAEYTGRLRDTGAFTSVDITLGEPIAGDSRRTVQVILDDKPARTLSAGVSYATDDGPGALAAWTKRNAHGGGETLTVEGRVQELESSLSTTYTIPAWRNPQRQLNMSASVGVANTDAFDRTAGEVAAVANQRLSRQWRGVLGVNAQVERIDDAASTADTFITTGASAGLSFDDTDDQLDPTSGFRASVQARPAFGYGDDPIGYVAVEGVLSSYLPMARERVVFASRLRSGALFGGAIGEIPASDRFFAGGGGSVRGFEFQSLSPRNADGDLIGGRSILEMSLETRVRFTQTIGAAAFVDAGVASTGASPEFSDVRTSAGVGLRYYTGFGPIRIDIAAPLDRRTGEDPFQVYIVIGQAF